MDDLKDLEAAAEERQLAAVRLWAAQRLIQAEPWNEPTERTTETMLPPLETYPLPPHVTGSLLDLARQSDVLLLGEVHGTQEAPRLVLTLLDVLAPQGYRGLALEIPADQRDALVEWASGDRNEPPPFFTHPFDDGRGNLQTLSLVRAAVQKGWQILCFDVGDDQPFEPWTERDRAMAGNFRAQADELCPGGKIVGVCGNFHSRLEPMPGELSRFWPSFAHNLHQAGTSVRSVAVWFRQGTYFNGGAVQTSLNGEPLAEALIAEGASDQHSLALHLPESTAVTFWPAPGA